MRIALELIEDQPGHAGTTAGLSLCGDVSFSGGDLTATTGAAVSPVRHELSEGESTIGRGDCTIRVPAKFGNVSRKHAQFTRTGDTVVVVDIGSTYGTFVNEIRITGPSTISVGDVVRLASRDKVFAEYRLVDIGS